MELVFDFLSDLDKHLQWITGMTYVHPRGRLRVGMEYVGKNSALGRELVSRVRVMRMEENRLIEFESVSRPMESVIQFENLPRNGGTQVIATLVLKSQHPVFGLARPLLESLAITRLEADLRNLKALVEAGPQEGF